MKLRNAQDEKITTIFGILFLLADLVYLIAPMFIKKEVETSWLVIGIVGLLGLGLILAPDDLYGLLSKKVSDKKL